MNEEHFRHVGELLTPIQSLKKCCNNPSCGYEDWNQTHCTNCPHSCIGCEWKSIIKVGENLKCDECENRNGFFCRLPNHNIANGKCKEEDLN